MKKAAITLVAIVLAASTIAFAQPPKESHGGERMKQRREHLKDALNLTDQQETQMKKLRLDLERKQAQVQSKIHLARLDMKEIYLSDKLDRSAIEKLIKQVSDLQHQEKMNAVDFWFSVNGILTPDQQKIWKQHIGEIGEGIRERFREGMRRGGPMMHDAPEDEPR